MASVAVIVHMMSFLGTPKCAARVSTRNTNTKKSKASRVQPKKPALTAWNRSVRDYMVAGGCSNPRMGALWFCLQVCRREVVNVPDTLRFGYGAEPSQNGPSRSRPPISRMLLYRENTGSEPRRSKTHDDR